MATKRFSGPGAWERLLIFSMLLEEAATRFGGSFKINLYYTTGTKASPNVLLGFEFYVPCTRQKKTPPPV